MNANIFLELQLDQQRADCIKEVAPTTDPLKLKRIWQLAEKQNLTDANKETARNIWKEKWENF